MNAGGETADQMVRMTLQGIEVAANVTLRAGGGAAKSIATMLYAFLTDKKKVKGRTRLDALLKSDKPLSVFALRHEDLKVFCKEAKKYGVLYSVLKEKNNKDGICDIMVRADDASKISRIIDKFELAKIDSKVIRETILSQQDNPIQDMPIISDKEHDEIVSKVMNQSNPEKARMTKSDNQSEPSLKMQDRSTKDKPSVRKQLNELKNSKSSKSPKQKQMIKKKSPKRKVR